MLLACRSKDQRLLCHKRWCRMRVRVPMHACVVLHQAPTRQGSSGRGATAGEPLLQLGSLEQPGGSTGSLATGSAERRDQRPGSQAGGAAGGAGRSMTAAAPGSGRDRLLAGHLEQLRLLQHEALLLVQ